MILQNSNERRVSVDLVNEVWMRKMFSSCFDEWMPARRSSCMRMSFVTRFERSCSADEVSKSYSGCNATSIPSMTSLDMPFHARMISSSVKEFLTPSRCAFYFELFSQQDKNIFPMTAVINEYKIAGVVKIVSRKFETMTLRASKQTSVLNRDISARMTWQMCGITGRIRCAILAFFARSQRIYKMTCENPSEESTPCRHSRLKCRYSANTGRLESKMESASDAMKSISSEKVSSQFKFDSNVQITLTF